MAIGNNNFGSPLTWIDSWPPNYDFLQSNNYFPEHSLWEHNPYHFDPQYIHPDTLIATNPAIAGLGSIVSDVPTDAFGNIRSSAPTIGAHEFCSEADTLIMECGEELVLKQCAAELYDSVEWTPSEFIVGYNGNCPLVEPFSSTVFYATDSNGIFIDSVLVLVDELVSHLPEEVVVPCGGGNWGRVYDYPLDTAEVQFVWTPDDPALYGEFNWYVLPDETSTYVLKLLHEFCGMVIDSVTVVVSDQPIAIGGPDSPTYQTAYFSHSSICAESVKWIFGDGDTSTLDNPVHFYEDIYGGWAFWKLIAYNYAGSDTLYADNYIIYEGDESIESYADGQNSMVVYPNPTSGILNIELSGAVPDSEIELLDIYERSVIRVQIDELNTEAFELNLSAQPAGVYILKRIDPTGSLLQRPVQVMKY